MTAPDISKPIALVGLMGSGKSAIGRKLAKRLSLPFFDSDTEVERAATLSIRDIFETWGEAGFRDVESRVIRALLDRGVSVIATGGGAFVQDDIRNTLKQRALSIWLDVEIDDLVERVKKRPYHRPLLNTDDPKASLIAQAEARNPYYTQADLHFPIAKRSSIDETIDRLYKKVEDHVIRT